MYYYVFLFQSSYFQNHVILKKYVFKIHRISIWFSLKNYKISKLRTDWQDSVNSKAVSPARSGIVAAFSGGKFDREPFLSFLLFLSQKNLISQASLVREGFAASIRTSSTKKEANPWASENRSLSVKAERREDGHVFVFLRVSRTYNKLKSHHPRDLAAITRP